MLIMIKVLSFISFSFIAWVLAGVLMTSLKDSCILKPAAISTAAASVAYHLMQVSGGVFVIGSFFLGFFVYACADAYEKKKGKPSPRKKQPKVNP